MEPTQQHTEIISEQDKEAFLAGLRSGLGLTQSASIIGLEPREITQYLKDNQNFYKDCLKAVKYQSKVMLVVSNQLLKDKNYRKWKEHNEYLKLFVSNLNLWESYCTKNDINNFRAAEAYVITNDKQEAATVCGMTIREYNEYLIKNPHVKTLIKLMLEA